MTYLNEIACLFAVCDHHVFNNAAIYPLQAPIFAKSLKKRCHCDKFLVNVSFCMCKIAKPSLLMTQFARQVAFVAKFSLLSDDKLLAKFQSIASNVKELRQFKKQSKTPICVVKSKISAWMRRVRVSLRATRVAGLCKLTASAKWWLIL